jgi:hypothetical protein
MITGPDILSRWVAVGQLYWLHYVESRRRA